MKPEDFNARLRHKLARLITVIDARAPDSLIAWQLENVHRSALILPEYREALMKREAEIAANYHGHCSNCTKPLAPEQIPGTHLVWCQACEDEADALCREADVEIAMERCDEKKVH